MTQNLTPNGQEATRKYRKTRLASGARRLLSAVLPAALVLLACGGSSDDPAANACEPGRTLACPCPGAADGVQTCKADGSAWNACECGAGGSGAGGSGASGGSAGSAQGGSSASGGSGASGGSAASGGSGAAGGSSGNGGTAGTASGGTSSGGSAGAGNGCPTGRGSEMVRISHPSGDYCIDKTEATKGHYLQFRADKDGDYSGQASYCEWNVDYGQGSCAPYNPTDNLNLPAACMDWCDADAFCKWAGKRLCGKVGGGGNAYGDADKQEWRNVCDAAGPMIPDDSCNGASPEPAEVNNGDCRGSQAGFEQLTHLLGNVSEWVHECSVGFLGNDEAPNSSCGYYGRSRADQQRDLSCAGSSVPRTYATNTRGVRCCATAEAN